MNDLLLLRHFWVAFVAVTFVNACILQRRSRPRVQERPELATGYRSLVRGYLFFGNLPWLVMGAGIELGGVPTVFSYLRPRDAPPFVQVWFAVIVGLWLLGFYWLFARHGAEFLIEHPGLLQGNISNPTWIRLGYCAMVAISLLAFGYLYTIDVPQVIR
jgi:hypothetical protein